MLQVDGQTIGLRIYLFDVEQGIENCYDISMDLLERYENHPRYNQTQKAEMLEIIKHSMEDTGKYLEDTDKYVEELKLFEIPTADGGTETVYLTEKEVADASFKPVEVTSEKQAISIFDELYSVYAKNRYKAKHPAAATTAKTIIDKRKQS